MKKITIFLFLCIKGLCLYSQSKMDTIEEKTGFLFLSNYNYLYDYNGEEVRPVGFHDFFFPLEKLDVSAFADSSLNFTFSDGLRIDFIEGRKQLKSQAFKFNGFDTSSCYEYNQFYILPVKLRYKKYVDNWPQTCHKNYFDIKVYQGSNLHFEHSRFAIKSIKVIKQIKKKSVNTRKKEKHK